MTAKQPVQTRERLLHAALQTLRVQGTGGLTLDAVAREASVSKGGLLHHFRSKDALIEAVLHQLLIDFDARVTALADADLRTPGRWLRAYVRATFSEEPLPREIFLMLWGAYGENAAFVAAVEADFERWKTRLAADGVPPMRAEIIRMAADAYYLEQMQGSISPAQRNALMDELLRLIEV